MSDLSPGYLLLKHRLIEAAQVDSRIVGLVDYGSTSEGRGDEWSDLDVALFVRDPELPAFVAAWKGWAARLGDLLLAYTGGIGHPWAVYRAEPIPIRADFTFNPASQSTRISTWPNSPISLEAMVWYDASGGEISRHGRALVGRSLAPDRPQEAFERCSGDLWYYLLRIHTKLQRRHLWAARWEYDFVVLDTVMWLLRIEVGAVERWQASSAAAGIEAVISVERLQRLDACIGSQDRREFEQAIRTTIALGIELCGGLADTHGWTWPQELAGEVMTLFTADPS